MFKGILKGTQLWAIGHGWGAVCYVSVDFFHMDFNMQSGCEIQYDISGREYSSRLSAYDINQTLFWEEVKIVPPPKPVYCSFMEAVKNLSEGKCVAIKRRHWSDPLRNMDGFLRFDKKEAYQFNNGFEHMLANDWVCLYK